MMSVTTGALTAAAAAAVLLLTGCSTPDVSDAAGAGRPVPTAPAPDRTHTGTGDSDGVAPYLDPADPADPGSTDTGAGGHHTDDGVDPSTDQLDDDGWIDGDLAEPGDVGVPAPVVGDDLDPDQIAAATDLAHLFLEQLNSWTPDMPEADRIAALEPILSDTATEQARRTADTWDQLDAIRTDSGDSAVATIDTLTLTHADPDRIDATATVQVDRSDRWAGWTQRIVVNVTLTPDGDGGWVVDRWAVR